MVTMEELACTAGAVGTGLILLCTISSLSSLISSLLWTQKSSVPHIYEDKDGVATEETTSQFSTKFPKICIGLSTCSGLAVAIAIAILGTLDLTEEDFVVEDWLNAASWFWLLVQAAAIALSKVPSQAYKLGIYGAASCSLLLAVLFLQDTILSQKRSDIGPVTPFVLRVAQMILTVVVGVAFVSLPRRPAVFKDGKPVDAEETGSAFSKYSFAWCLPLLSLAKKNRTLDLLDLPRPNHRVRARDVTEKWLSETHSGRLWVQVTLAHKWALILQWSLTLMQAVGNFAPQYVLLHLLRLLEKRQVGKSVSSEAWIWVLALGLSTIVSAWIESWLFWISQAELTLPVRAELSSLIFQKAMRRKDIKGAGKSGGKGDDKSGSLNSPDSKGESTSSDKPKKKEGEDFVTKQSTINLIGVDARRVGDFCSYNNYFPGSIFKLFVSFGFLLTLIGWESLLAGIGVMALLTPLNIFFSKRYAKLQEILMKVRDEKLAVVTEALQGLRQIKFMGAEQQWQDKINGVRTRELFQLFESFKADAWLLFCWFSSPILFSATSLAVYAIVYGELTPSIAFTAIGVFKQLEVTLAVLPELTTDLIDALVSINRIEAYLAAPEIALNKEDSPSIIFTNASIAWPSDEEKKDGDERYMLRDINVSFPNNELSVISGKTGSGKSLLLASILGEAELLSGGVDVPKAPSFKDRRDQYANLENWIIPSSIAFVAQIPWIENATIKNNILFGLPLDDYRYNKTIEVCALQKDLDMLPDGERTEIGANGVNLSGGQRWRITFARALYSRAGVLVLDDIFSAVDAHVGRFIFEQGLTGELGVGRTRILVTHHVALCKPRTKYFVQLDDGTVEYSGFLSELEEDGILTKIISSEISAIQDESGITNAVNSKDSSDGEAAGEVLTKVDSKSIAKKFVEDEKREQGAISKRIYWKYMQASGGLPFWAVAVLLFILQQAITFGRTWWLRIWTGSYEEANIMSYIMQKNSFQIKPLDEDLKFYLIVYVVISVGSSILATLKFLYIFVGSINASRRLFERLTFTVLRTPLRWVDITPVGRTLNRFVGDFVIVDSRLAMDIGFTAGRALQLVGVIVAGLFVSPYIIVLALGLAAVCLRFASFYLAGAREVKRLESTSKSPIFEQFGSALSGVATIRGFDNIEAYVDRMYEKQDDWTATFWYLWLFNRWVGWRMAMIGALFSATVASLILTINSIDAALAGFALAFSLEYSDAVIWTIRHYTSLELDMNAAERIVEFSELPIEDQGGSEPPAAWPSEGRIEINDLVVGYAPDLPPVLKGLTLSIGRNERIGVVGRTGAGKSSLTLALFRFLEAREGSIYIDGLDISKLQLHSFRGRLAIIPQDPVLFVGSIRDNLDGFNERSDNELRDALERVHLVSAPNSRDEQVINQTSSPSSPAETISQSSNQNVNPFASLTSPITEGGLNLSQGQRQLLCLARAIISRPKIMVLDEATSAVDMATDALIQRSIREEFTDSTLIVIAHRLSTIADFDKILVMSDGNLAEFDTPKKLMENQGGVFRNMVRDSGERDVIEQMILGTI